MAIELISDDTYDRRHPDHLETRVVRLEIKTDNHADDIKVLRTSNSDLSAAMVSIEKTLAQIKYIGLGGLTVIIAQSIGLDKALKLLFGA